MGKDIGPEGCVDRFEKAAQDVLRGNRSDTRGAEGKLGEVEEAAEDGLVPRSLTEQ